MNLAMKEGMRTMFILTSLDTQGLVCGMMSRMIVKCLPFVNTNQVIDLNKPN